MEGNRERSWEVELEIYMQNANFISYACHQFSSSVYIRKSAKGANAKRVRNNKLI